MTVSEEKLQEKLRRIEALFAGATTEGERIAAAEAKRRIQLRLEAIAREDPPVEYRFTLADDWSRMLFLALLRRYGIKPYRYRRQRRTTVMARVSTRFVDETLWPEFVQLSDALRQHLAAVTRRVIAAAIHDDDSDASEVESPRRLE